jgi:hypothetical protein
VYILTLASLRGKNKPAGILRNYNENLSLLPPKVQKNSTTRKISCTVLRECRGDKGT